MREIRLSGSEGGAIQTNESLLPLSVKSWSVVGFVRVAVLELVEFGGVGDADF